MNQAPPNARFVRHSTRSPVRASRKRPDWRQSARHSQHGQQVQQQNDLSVMSENLVNQYAFWSQETHSLTELSDYDPLPQIVRCTSQLLPGEELPVNIHVPMLLCAGRSSQKLLAKHVGLESRSRRLRETDDSIVIPDDYTGNFLRLQAQTTKDQSVMKSLVQIAESKSPAFLTLSPLTVFYQDEQMQPPTGNPRNTKPVENGTSPSLSSAETSRISSNISGSSRPIIKQQRVVMPPGSVFLINGVYKGYAKTKKKSREVPMLRCSDPNGQVCVIAADQPGEFVESAIPTNGDVTLSKKCHELMENNRYPSLVRFVYGNHIPRLRPCSYLFTLVDTFTEDTMIGCLLYPRHAIMIELPVNSSLRFQMALNTEELLKLELPAHALKVIDARKDNFMKDLKLKCKFLHHVSRGQSVDIMDELSSATVRTRQYANESSFYL